jgi:hypothetical protein
LKTDEPSLPTSSLDKPRPLDPGSLKKPAISCATITLIVLICVIVLYGHRWLSGETIFRGAIQEQYYLLGQYPFDHRIVTDFKDGYFPLWNPMNGLGTPLIGNMVSGVFYPLKVVIYLFDTLFARDVYIVLRLLVAALLAFALARALGLSFFPSALAALAFTFTGYFKMFVNENYLNADVLVPGMVLLTLRLRDNKKFRDVILMGLLVFAVINNGYPEAAFYSLLLSAFLVVATTPGPGRLARTIILFSIAFAIGIILSLPMFLPFLEYWGRGYHFHVPGTGFFHYSANQLVSLVSPWFFGAAPAGAPFHFTLEIVWPHELTGVPAYSKTIVPWLAPAIGIVPFFLFVLGASKVKSLGRTETALLIWALFFMGVMFGLPIFRWLGLLPIFSFSGNFKHPLPGVALCMALLAGRGLEMILRRRMSGERIATVLVVMLIGVLFLGTVYEPMIGGPPFLNKYSGTMLMVLVATGAWLAWSAASGEKIKERRALPRPVWIATGLMALAAAIASLVIDGFAQPMRDPGYEKRIGAGNGISRLEDISALDRVYISQDLSPPNLNILFDLADVRVMDPINDRRLIQAINRINNHDRSLAGTYFYREVGYPQPMPDKLNHPLLKLMNVRYALMDGPLPYNRTIWRLLSEADVIAPGPGYVGRAMLPLSGSQAPGILQHPPSRTSWDPAVEDSFRIRFQPSMTDLAKSKQADGAWLMIMAGDSLAFSRYLHPRTQKGDALLPMMDLELDCREDEDTCRDLAMASVPGASPDFDQVGWADFRAGGPELFDSGAWEELERGETWLYRNPNALPRVFLASRSEPADDAEVLELLARAEVDPQDTVFLSDSKQFGEEQPAIKGVPGQVKVYDYSAPQHVRIEVDLWQDGWLVAGDLYYPGWHCLVDGKPKPIQRANFCMRAVSLDKGSHTVEMTYRPGSFRIGLWSMISAFSGLLAILGLKRKTSIFSSEFSSPGHKTGKK